MRGGRLLRAGIFVAAQPSFRVYIDNTKISFTHSRPVILPRRASGCRRGIEPFVDHETHVAQRRLIRIRHNDPLPVLLARYDQQRIAVCLFVHRLDQCGAMREHGTLIDRTFVRDFVFLHRRWDVHQTHASDSVGTARRNEIEPLQQLSKVSSQRRRTHDGRCRGRCRARAARTVRRGGRSCRGFDARRLSRGGRRGIACATACVRTESALRITKKIAAKTHSIRAMHVLACSVILCLAPPPDA